MNFISGVEVNAESTIKPAFWHKLFFKICLKGYLENKIANNF